MTYEEFVKKIDEVEKDETDMPIAVWQFVVKTDKNTVGYTMACMTECDERVVDDDGKPHYLYGERTKECIKQSFIDVSKKYNIIGCTYGKNNRK